MPDSQLVLSIPQGIITATSLGIEGLARHYSPGSGKHFTGRKLFVELAVSNDQPDFEYLNGGDWRDAKTDSINALAAASAGNRTKTALSNNAFSCTPIEAYKNIFLVKTAGHVMAMESAGQFHAYKTEQCHEGMSLSEVSEAAGCNDSSPRRSHLYLVMCPIQLLLLSNLSPVEYAWYSTHRPGKIFRQVIFTELKSVQSRLAAESRFVDAQQEINSNPDKKTKTIVSGDCINEVPFRAWCGYGDNTEGGLYTADHGHINLWQFPKKIPVDWDRASC